MISGENLSFPKRRKWGHLSSRTCSLDALTRTCWVFLSSIKPDRRISMQPLPLPSGASWMQVRVYCDLELTSCVFIVLWRWRLHCEHKILHISRPKHCQVISLHYLTFIMQRFTSLRQNTLTLTLLGSTPFSWSQTDRFRRNCTRFCIQSAKKSEDTWWHCQWRLWRPWLECYGTMLGGRVYRIRCISGWNCQCKQQHGHPGPCSKFHFCMP